MINAHSKPNHMQNNAGQYETFSFWFSVDFEQCHLLDKYGIWPCYFVPTLGNLPLRGSSTKNNLFCKTTLSNSFGTRLLYIMLAFFRAF